MSKQVTAGRRAAFLRALGETGSLTLSAERAKVNKDWSLWHRKRDPAFAAACREAMAKAKASLDLARDERGFLPPKGWGSLDGVQLVVRGAPGRRTQIRRARVDGWSPAVEDRFLATLAATCNVKASCAEIRMTQASAYYHRRRWPAFARRWAAAEDEGYARLEIALVENGANVFSGEDLPPEMAMPPMTADQALHLLHLHKHAVRNVGKPAGPRWWRRTLDEVRASIIRKLEAIENGEAVSAETRARDEAEWALRRRSG